MRDLFEHSGVLFSKCARYRYRLWRRWGDEPHALFVMLNPSTADEIVNDPTVERCERRSRSMGFGGLEVANIFALRSTDPGALYEAQDPVGAGNDEAILEAAQGAGIIICAWGNHGKHLGRGDQVQSMLQRAWPEKLHALVINRDGSPKHPLYVGYDVKPTPWLRTA